MEPASLKEDVMETSNQKPCHCQGASCECAETITPRCDCGDSCDCQRGCGREGGCGCAETK